MSNMSDTSDITQQLFPGRYFVSTVLETLDTKARMSWELRRVYVQRAAMAGVLIGIFYATNYGLVATFDSVATGGGTTLRPLGVVVGALTFGWALVFIYFTKSELLTSNMMIVSVGGYYQRIGTVKGLRLLAFCYLGNLLGGVFIAVLLRFTTVLDGGALGEMSASVDHKLEYVTEGIVGWGDLFVRAILCNLMINLAMLMIYNGVFKEDITKSVAMIVSVFVFMFLGFEHSVANTVLFFIVGLQEGIDVIAAVGNVTIALLGNFVGGGVLIGLYYAYVNDDARYLRKHQELLTNEEQ
jgi:formate/nitrite transporter FocA (FNT family)